MNQQMVTMRNKVQEQRNAEEQERLRLIQMKMEAERKAKEEEERKLREEEETRRKKVSARLVSYADRFVICHGKFSGWNWSSS